MERKRLFPYIFLQILPLLILPPSMLLSDGGISSGAIALIVALVVIYSLLGWGLYQGKRWALTMSIFLQGMNVIVRLMMLFPNAVSKDGVWDVPLIIAHLVAIVVSGWLLVRLDRPDIQSMITT